RGDGEVVAGPRRYGCREADHLEREGGGGEDRVVRGDDPRAGHPGGVAEGDRLAAGGHQGGAEGVDPGVVRGERVVGRQRGAAAAAGRSAAAAGARCREGHRAVVAGGDLVEVVQGGDGEAERRPRGRGRGRRRDREVQPRDDVGHLDVVDHHRQDV